MNIENSKSIGTVCFITSNNQVLLAEIQYPNGDLLWNGIGGVVDPNETAVQAVVREISEETGLKIKESDVVEMKTIQLASLQLHIFVASRYSGKLEAHDPTIKQLKWYGFDELPYKSMHKNNDKWLPGILDKLRA